VNILRGALVRIGRSYARLVTDVVVRFPALWPLFRGALRKQFDQLSPRWDSITGEDHLAPYEAALASIVSPRRALDLGTGTGAGAFAVARRFPQAEVVGADLAEGMLAEARRKTPPELSGHVRFERADAAHLPYADDAFDLVGLVNMIPFFDELARVVAPRGTVVMSFSGGPETPIWVPFDRLRRELERRGFSEFAEFSAGRGVALVARKAGRA